MNTPHPPRFLWNFVRCLRAICLLSLGSSIGFCQVIVATIPLTLGGGGGVLAVNETTNRVYVVQQNATQVIDGATSSVIASIPGGSVPVAIAVNEITNKIYVANHSSDTVSVIDGGTNAALDLAVGAGPQAIAINAVTNKIYVVCQNSDQLAIIDGITNTVTLVAVGSSPGYVAVDTQNNRIYVVNQNGNSVSVVDGASN